MQTDHLSTRRFAGFRKLAPRGLLSRIQTFRCRVTVVVLGVAALLLPTLLPLDARAASFQQDADGFVVMEAENFDVNVTQDTGFWIFDNTPLAFDPFSGGGYMKAFSAGGTDPNISPHADFKVSFTNSGPHYIWVLGSGNYSGRNGSE